MKKYFKHTLLLSVLITTIFSFSALVSVTPVQAEVMTISDLVELLITIGAIAPDKAVAARAVVTSLNQALLPNTTIIPFSNTIVSTTTSYVQVLTPNTKVNWEIDLDLPYSITWGSQGLTQARIALVSSVKKTPICELTPAPITSRNGNNEFEILLKTAQCYDLSTGTSTLLTDGTYYAKVYFTDPLGTTISDQSDVSFKVLPKPIPSIKVTYPNGGESLTRNHEYNVTYRLTNVTNVVNNLIYLYLLDNNGNTAYNSHKIKRSDGTYSLDLPSSLSAGAYKIKLITTTSDEKVELEDMSDSPFWISTGL